MIMARVTSQQRGMALIAVLWLVASMSLIIAGVVRSVRSEVQNVGTQRQQAIGAAAADAAILLALQRLSARPNELPKDLQTMTVSFNNASYAVQVMPLNGLLDINNAPVSLLTDLYQFVAGLSPDAASNLAQATLAARQAKGTKGRALGFDAVPDLMRVPGMRYEVYAKVAPLLTTDIKNGSGRINPLVAPLPLLVVLASGNTARAAQFANQRDAHSATLDTSFFKPEFIEMAASNNLMFQVDAPLPDGRVTRNAWRVFWGADAQTGLPWRVLGVQQSNSLPGLPLQ